MENQELSDAQLGPPSSEDSPGPEINFTMEEPFETGRVYVALCFVSDRAGGPPHAIAHDMVKVFTAK